ncbi:cell wall-binding repeat-containing protein [Bacillus carboniphilus]|uniref:Cell wall-binding repeat-containing protein n=2 Tax=Bacillus carboniphilus TaxID=86663 RepID=A0ABY9K138_9BACI|nr:cell wall-binding repeat-containing protein [Bacillus carboniphilus]WLR44313.1 cell wall-binding repeat-containing protein [Bacillus carboniphilus]
MGGEDGEQSDRQVTRLAGEDRYETNIDMLQELEDDSAKNIIISSGENYPDALAGGVLNSTHEGAMVLVNEDEKVLKNAEKEVARLLQDGGKVYILGGEKAVPKSIENFFDKDCDVERLAGETRIHTAMEIAEAANKDSEEVFLAYGYSFADALSVTPAEAKHKMPILLTDEKHELNDDVKNYLEEHKVKKVTIVGGEAVVGKEIAKELEGMKIEVDRKWGEDRYFTSLEIAKSYFNESEAVAVSNGMKFPDALGGGTLAYRKDMPILLAQSDKAVKETVEFIGMKDIYIYGGKMVISDDLEKSWK